MITQQRGADLIVRCLEAAGVEFVFGIPGEENLDLVDAMNDSPIRFIVTRHEQAAAFMADVYARLTGRTGICTATLGPGATNLVTGIADAYLDRAPLLAIAGQGATTRLHKESHQIIDLAALFETITKSAMRITEAEAIAETVAAALSLSQAHKPGPTFLALPENIAAENCDGEPLKIAEPRLAQADSASIADAARCIADARQPLLLIGNGVVRAGAVQALHRFADCLGAPFTTTFMAKGSISDRHPMALSTTGLSQNENTRCGFDQADLVIAIGYDLVEFDPAQWHRDSAAAVLHIDVLPAEIDRNYLPGNSLVGDIDGNLSALTAALDTLDYSPPADWAEPLRDRMRKEMQQDEDSASFPIKPQRLLRSLRDCLDDDAILISDVGAHKVWIAHQWQAYLANTCIISNGFAAMGIGLPGAIAAKLAYPQRQVVTATGDAGLQMNAQELETAVRLGLEIVILVWNDGAYGLIEWHQQERFGRSNDVYFGNPDLVAFAESFGARGFRVENVDALDTTLRDALACGTVALIDCPVDYAENMRLNERLGRISCGG